MEDEDQMTHQAATKRRHAPATYRDLTAALPLRPLHDEVDYKHALKMAEALVGLVRPTVDQADYLDVLADIIQKYESTQHAIGGRADPIDALKSMMEEQGMSGSDLGRLFGNRALGSLVLNRQRTLSKANILKLAEHFHVSADLFLVGKQTTDRHGQSGTRRRAG
jgi:HTH-type transcriptional regulator/antitoxin HigA